MPWCNNCAMKVSSYWHLCDLSNIVQRINAHLHAKMVPAYLVNLDPAVHDVPFPANIGK